MREIGQLICHETLPLGSSAAFSKVPIVVDDPFLPKKMLFEKTSFFGEFKKSMTSIARNVNVMFLYEIFFSVLPIACKNVLSQGKNCNQVVIAQWLAQRLFTREVPGSNMIERC